MLAVHTGEIEGREGNTPLPSEGRIDHSAKSTQCPIFGLHMDNDGAQDDLYLLHTLSLPYIQRHATTTEIVICFVAVNCIWLKMGVDTHKQGNPMSHLGPTHG